MSKRRALLALAATFALVVALGWYVLRLTGIRVLPRPGAERPWAIMGPSVIYGMDEEGRKVVEIHVQGASVSQRGVYDLWGIDPAIWYRGEEGVVMASAGRGTYNERTRDAEISGGLKVSSKDGFFLETEELRWEYRPREIICPGALTVRHHGFTGQSDFAKYLVQEQKLICPNKVTGSIAQHVSISGEGLVIDGKTQELTLEKVSGTIELGALEKHASG
jgi:hypothetical protein